MEQYNEDTIVEKASRNSDGWYMKLLRWREDHIPEKSFVVILAIIIGVASGLAAVLLKFLIGTISGLVNSVTKASQANYYYLVFPIIGIFLTGIYVRYVVRDNISHGVTRVLYAIAQKKSRLKFYNMYASLASSSVTIGCGGSVGAEGPIVFTGAAIGSNLGQAFRLSPHMLMMLVGCGAAAGIAGIFKAPIAGVLFTVEVLMLDLTAGSVMPLIMASVAGATVAYVFTGYNVEFFFTQSEMFYTSRIPYVVLLGVFCGLVSVYFTKMIEVMERMFGRISCPRYRFFLGSILLSVLIFVFPPLFGEGYESINYLLNGHVEQIFNNSLFYGMRSSVGATLLLVGALCFMKVFATSATDGGGGVGGTFAPSLYVGCMAGFLFAYAVNSLGIVDPTMPLSTKNFALVGMAGVMAGVMHAPLMAIFLTAEMTGGYSLFLPLLIVAAISYGTSRIFSNYSIYTKRLALQGELLTHQKDKTVLTLLKMDSVIETDFIPVHPDMSLKEMVDVISKSKRNLFPVTDDDGQLLGIVLLDDIRNIMFRPDLYRRMHVKRFMSMPPAKVELGTPMDQVMKMFDNTGAWNLPVVEEGRYVGFVSKSKIFNSYRQVLKHYSYD
ncbi:MAG: chloride channel protein [Porphyromonadaceae bacterium]|nr:MAG: chloride channel protein [Porphyromonadaceae bacterium]